MTDIHPSAMISTKAKIGDGVRIGPYCVVGDEVVLEDGVELLSHVVVEGLTRIGANTHIFPFSSIGHRPQDLKYQGEPSRLEIGCNNVIREHNSCGTKGLWRMTPLQLCRAIKEEAADQWFYANAIEQKLLADEQD